MKFDDAVLEFADMLTVASGALRNLAKRERGRIELKDLLDEMDKIADRIRSIGVEVGQRTLPDA